MAVTVEEHELGLTWVVEDWMQRACHALVDEGRVWLIDPVDVDDVVDQAAELGEPMAVLQLLDRHNRDCETVANRLGVPHIRLPERLPDSPFTCLRVLRLPVWKETALWWPERRVLVVAEVVGSNRLYTTDRGPLGIHPMLRAHPPGSLREFKPAHLLLGHGSPLHGPGTAAALEQAYARSRRDIPRLLRVLPSLRP